MYKEYEIFEYFYIHTSGPQPFLQQCYCFLAAPLDL